MNVGNYLKFVGQPGVLDISRTLKATEALTRMNEHHSRSLIVTDDESHLPIGFVNMNILANLLLQIKDLPDFRVAQIMRVFTDDDLVHPDTPLATCAGMILEDGKTHLAIGKKGEPLQAVFSPTDWLRILNSR